MAAIARRRGGPRLDAALVARQVQPEGRALALGAVDPDMAARLLGEAVDHRQPEAGALADRLGREERLEDLRERVRRHADAGVADADDGVVAGVDLLLAEPFLRSR